VAPTGAHRFDLVVRSAAIPPPRSTLFLAPLDALFLLLRCQPRKCFVAHLSQGYVSMFRSKSTQALCFHLGQQRLVIFRMSLLQARKLPDVSFYVHLTLLSL